MKKLNKTEAELFADKVYDNQLKITLEQAENKPEIKKVIADANKKLSDEIKEEIERRKKDKKEKEDKAQGTGTGFTTDKAADTATGKFSGSPKGNGGGKKSGKGTSDPGGQAARGV